MNFKKGVSWFFRIILLIILGLSIYYFFPEDKLPANVKIDSVVVYKSQKRLYAYSGEKLLKIYKISVGRNLIGKKEYEGDNKTPEGLYYINDKNPNSGYHKNLGISYPNDLDKLNAKKLGKATGGDIKIHALRNDLGFIKKFHYWFSTRGCIRVTNEEIDELYQAVDLGTKIEIKP